MTEALLGGDDDAAVAARLRVSHPWAEGAVGDLLGVCAQVRAGTLRPLFSAPEAAAPPHPSRAEREGLPRAEPLDRRSIR